mmetsp:Transcript_9131/g.29047  ORF Transcript_9131/g.29047 Transcript_9131/m.29047 type:complete len:413 (-) Transcript_9131:21-1259(-)
MNVRVCFMYMVALLIVTFMFVTVFTFAEPQKEATVRGGEQHARSGARVKRGKESEVRLSAVGVQLNSSCSCTVLRCEWDEWGRPLHDNGTPNLTQTTPSSASSTFFSPLPALASRLSLTRSLLILVPSRFAEGPQRMAIRRTWGRWARDDATKLLFIVDTAADAADQGEENLRLLLEEASVYGDLLVDRRPGAASYRNLTSKTVAALSIASQCSNADLAAKADSDSYVRLDGIRERESEDDADVWAHVTRNWKPVGEKEGEEGGAGSSKWYLTEGERAAWRELVNPPSVEGDPTSPPLQVSYPHGPFYLMTRKALTRALAGFQSTPNLVAFPWEDVAVGIALRNGYMRHNGEQVKYRHADRFSLWCDEGSRDAERRVLESGRGRPRLVWHGCAPDDMVDIHVHRRLAANGRK